MKKILLILAFMIMTLMSFSQVKFMGIAVDGTKIEMINKLKQKGFVYNSTDDCLKGQFNGKSVDVYIHLNKNKVDRIYVVFSYTRSEADIIGQFNSLYTDFYLNDKYTYKYGTKINLSEDISYEITCHNKTYEANFLQNDNSEIDNLLFTDKNYNIVHNKTLKLISDDNMTTEYNNTIESMTKEEIFSFDKSIISFYSEITIKNSVWFRISEYYGQYWIGLYYDNELNRPHGEDL